MAQRLSRMANTCFATLFALALVLSTAGGGPVSAQALDDGAADIMAEIGDVAEEIAGELEAVSDPADAAVAALGADADALLGFVGGEVAYTPYRGVLRGVAGVLEARAGNSYDQAIAAASLLKRSGYEAQVLIGAMPEDDAPFSRTRRAAPLVDLSRIDPLYEELLELSAELAEEMDTDAPAYREPVPVPDAGWAAAAVADALALLPEGETDGANPEADLYALLRYRRTPTDDWTWFDPARNRTVPAGDATTRAVLNETVPPDHLHQVAIVLSLVTANGEARTIGGVKAPALSLVTRPLTIAIVPAEQTRAAPVVAPYDPRQNLIVSSTLFESQAVSLNGTVVPAEAMASGMGAVFQTGADLLGDAIETLKTGEAGKARPFERLVLTVTGHGPGRAPIVSERVLYDGATARAAMAGNTDFQAMDGAGRDAMVRAHLLSEVAGDYIVYAGGHGAGAKRVELDLMRALAALGEDLADGALNSPAASDVMGDVIVAAIWRDLGRLFDEEGDGDEAVRHVAPSVALLAARRRLEAGYAAGTLHVATDIFLDGRAAADGGAAAGAMAAIDAAAREAALVDRLSVLDDAPFDAPGSFEHLQARIEGGVAPVAVADHLASLDAGSDDPLVVLHRAFLESQVAQGRGVVVWPGGTVAETTWLEVDPATGTARLASGIGAGNELTEYIIAVDFILLKALVNLNACREKQGDARAKCNACAIFKTGVAVVGALGGAGLALAVIGGTEFAAEVACQ